MRDIKYVEDELSRKNNYLESIARLNLGFLLKGLYYADRDIKDEVSNGVFKIAFDCHDTGVSTSSYIIKPDGELYQIASRTYWYDESTYGFNKKWYENGAWDDKYNIFIEELRAKLITLTEKKIEDLEQEIVRINENKASEKSSVEEMFL